MRHIQTLLFILFVLCFNQAQAKIVFLKGKDEAWKARVLNTIADINDFLPDSIEKPDTFIIAYVSGADSGYYTVYKFINPLGAEEIVDRILLLGDDPEETLVHEYGHVVLDHHFRSFSKPWHHYLVSQYVSHNDIQKSFQSYSKAVSGSEKDKIKYEEILKNDPNNESAQKILGNVNSSLKRNRRILKKLTYALQIQEEYDFEINSGTTFKSFSPFNELFADTLAALYYSDWDIMGKTVHASYMRPNGLDGVLLPPADSTEDALSLLASHRNFLENIDLETYEFADWESLTPYEQLRPARSAVRNLYENGDDAKTVLSKLMNTVADEFHDKIVVQSALDQRSLFEKNKSIINSLTSQ